MNKIIEELQAASAWFEEHGKNTNTAIVGICARAIDHINRQEAEIDKLTKLNDILLEAGQRWQKRYESAQVETVEFLKKAGLLEGTEFPAIDIETLIKKLTEERAQ